MAKTNDPKILLKNIKKDFDRYFKDKSMWDAVGKRAVGIIRGLTQSGFGVDKKLGKPVQFQPLSKTTVERRTYISDLARTTKPEISHLRETGQMFEDLKHYPTDKSVTIDFATERSKEIAQGHHEGNKFLPKRPFMNFSPEQFRVLISVVNKFIVKKLKEN